MLLQQPQLLKTRVNMSFVTLPSLCKLTASGSAQSCTFIRITKSQEIQVQNWCSRKREFYHAPLREWVLTNQQAAERQQRLDDCFTFNLLAAGTRLDNNYSHKVKLQHLFVCSNLV